MNYNDLDATHEPSLRSWVDAAQEHPHFPIQNLPFGIASRAGELAKWPACAIGDMVVNLAGIYGAGLLSGLGRAGVEAALSGTLNGLFALGAPARKDLRRQLSRLLALGNTRRDEVLPHLVATADCVLHVPTQIGDYSDFFTGIHHASNTGKLFRPASPLLPNYKHVPIAYHGRSSSVVASGTPVIRPMGQTKLADQPAPQFGPCRKLDYELELGLWIGPGNRHGEPISIEQAAGHIVGITLLNDWSARDIQTWEYQPLGPFLSKSFATTVSPWVVTLEALAPFRVPQPPRGPEDPAALPYLFSKIDQSSGAFDIRLQVALQTSHMRREGQEPTRIASSNALYMYWTAAQLVTHQTSNGCNLRPGDLIGTGTLSGPGEDQCGALLESTSDGCYPLRLPHGETRTYLEDDDEIVLTATCSKPGFVSIGLGECRGRIQASPSSP